MTSKDSFRETKNLEFKEQVTNTFLKTISAFANYGGGQVVFGINDAGEVVGLENPQAATLVIEEKINNAIEPLPRFTLDIRQDRTIWVDVQEGPHKPYTYKGKAYQRADSSTVEVSRLELQRLVLAGTHQSFEGLPATEQNLRFATLESELMDRLNVSGLTADVLKTLDLYSDVDGYNRAAALLADRNSFVGIDIARFGESIDIIRERKTFSGISVISQLHQATELFDREYVHEEISGMTRIVKERVPREAFREALANALIHRSWDVAASIKVSMFEDRIEVTSPGGLPPGISEAEYLDGFVSLLRNPILGTVFFRLGYVETFGTGVARIRASYADSHVFPKFRVREQSITVVLPVKTAKARVSARAEQALGTFVEGQKYSRATLDEALGTSPSTTSRIIQELLEAGYIRRTGRGPATSYSLQV